MSEAKKTEIPIEEGDGCSIAGCSREGFTQALGHWQGTAEVYSGEGRFLGNAVDQRHVRTAVDDKTVRIDLAFVGPVKFSGHYTIQDNGDHRIYQGPANYGFAEPLGPNLVDANAYWPGTGLTQRLFLLVLPDNQRQVSLSLMSRGEQLLYTIVGEYARAQEDRASAGKLPGLIDGTTYDLGDDPTAGRGELLLHRPGKWSGELRFLDASLTPQGTVRYEEAIRAEASGLSVRTVGGAFATEPSEFTLRTNGLQAWTPPGDTVGSYNLCGGRALVGTFHRHREGLRVWRREVVLHGGAEKVVVHTWYRGGARVGVQHGVLEHQA